MASTGARDNSAGEFGNSKGVVEAIAAAREVKLDAGGPRVKLLHSPHRDDEHAVGQKAGNPQPRCRPAQRRASAQNYRGEGCLFCVRYLLEGSSISTTPCSKEHGARGFTPPRCFRFRRPSARSASPPCTRNVRNVHHFLGDRRWAPHCTATQRHVTWGCPAFGEAPSHARPMAPAQAVNGWRDGQLGPCLLKNPGRAPRQNPST